jgi:hypothetical protein
VTVIFLDECEYGPLPAGVAVTDATDGAVRFEDVSTERRRTVRSGSITVALPFVPPLLVPVDLKSPATAPVRLRLPPTGRVRCEVVDQTGSPAPDGRVVLLRNPAIDDRTMWRTDFSSRIDDARATTSAGAAVFEHVGRDVALEVEIPPADDSQLTVKQRFAGPKAAGETVVLRVALGGARPAFVGRVVDAAKTPVAGLALVAEIAEQGGSTSAESKCTTDDDGRFRFAFDRVPGPAPGAKLLVARPFSRHSLFRDLQSLATIDLPDAIGDGEKDVGTIVCDSARPLVAGVVVDDADRPLAGVAVSVVGGDSDDATTDSDGRFQIIGNPSPSRLIRLGAALDGRYVVAANSDFAAGTTDARIVMAPSGGLAGSVQVPADRPLPEMRVVIVGRPAGLGDGRSRDDGESCFIKEDGRFEAPTLRPGDARVEFRRGFSGGRVLLAIDHVKIESGSITRDPRLQLVDVAKLVNGPTITVVDADGRPVRRADVQFRLGPGGAWQSADSTDARGATLIPTESIGGPESMFDVVVTQFGFNTTSLHDVTGDQTIILPKAARSVVHLRLASSSPLPAPPSNLSAELLWIGPGAEERPRSGDPRNVRAFGRTFSKDREMTLEAAPGRYRVQLMLLETEFNESMISSIGSVPKSIVVTVGTDGAPAEAVIGVDPDELKDHQTRAR